MISIKEISKHFGKNQVFSNLSFEIEAGKFYTLLGKNGLGKSTIIKIISGFLKPDRGEVIIDEENTYNNKAFIYKKKLGCLLEEPIYIEKFTIKEYLEFICKLFGMHTEDFLQKINYYLNYFDCLEYQNVFIENCSKGTKQKVSIISTLLHNPKYLIFDEPFNGLDDSSKVKLLSLLKNVCNDGGSVLLATHDYNHTIENTDCFLILNKQNDARLTQINTIENTRDNQLGLNIGRLLDE